MNKTRSALQVMVFAIISILAIAYTATNVLRVSFGSDMYHVTADLPTAGGLFVGSSVTYRGIEIGSVRRLDITRYGVQVDFEVKRDAEVPADATARVHDFSVAGEQYLDLSAPDDSGPMLTDGDRVRAAADPTPVPVAEVFKSLQDTIKSLDPQRLGTVSRELSTGLTGTADDLSATIDASITLVSTLQETLPATERLLVNSDTVFQTLNEHSAELVSFADNLEKLSGTLEAQSGDLDALLTTAPGALSITNQLLRDIDGSVRTIVRNLLPFSALQVQYLANFDRALDAIPELTGLLPAVVRNGRLQAATLFSYDQPVCTYEDQQLTSPLSGFRSPLKRAVCADPQRADISRGAR